MLKFTFFEQNKSDDNIVVDDELYVQKNGNIVFV